MVKEKWLLKQQGALIMQDLNIFSQINLMHWFLQSIAMGVTAFLLPGLRITSLIGGLLAVVALAFVNVHLWDAALFFHIPDKATTQTAITFLANGLIFWIIVKILPGIEIDGFFSALAAPIIFTVTTVLLNKYLPLVEWNFVWQSAHDFFQSIKALISSHESGGLTNDNAARS